MGVMACSRKHCDNIMCDTYINDVGYICYSCKEEFKDYLTNNSIFPKNSRQAKEALLQFMETNKLEVEKDSNFNIDEFLNQ